MDKEKPRISIKNYPKLKRSFWKVSNMPKPYNSRRRELWRLAHQFVCKLNSTMEDREYDWLIHLNGIEGFVFSVRDEGREITLSGWDNRHWSFKEGHSVLLINKDGTETRYKFTSLEHWNGMYIANCAFFPRK